MAEKNRVRRSEKKDTLWKRMLRAEALALSVAVLLAAGCAAMVIGGIIPPRGTETLASILAGVGTLAGAAYLCGCITEKRLIAAASFGASSAAVFLLGNLAFVKGAPVGFARITLPCLGASVAASLIVSAAQQKGRRRRRF